MAQNKHRKFSAAYNAAKQTRISRGVRFVLGMAIIFIAVWMVWESLTGAKDEAGWQVAVSWTILQTLVKVAAEESIAWVSPTRA